MREHNELFSLLAKFIGIVYETKTLTKSKNSFPKKLHNTSLRKRKLLFQEIQNVGEGKCSRSEQ